MCTGLQRRMFNCNFSFLHGSYKMRLGLSRVLDLREMFSWFKLLEQTSWVVLTGLENFIEFIQACLGIPKKVILMCLHLQKKLLMLPINVVNKLIVTPFLSLATIKSVPVVNIETQTPAQILTGEENPSSDKIIAACREIRCSTLKSIGNTSKAPSTLCDYKQQLDKWKVESEKRTEEIYRIGAEDKELMKAVASGLRCLKALKNKREKMHDNFNKSITTMITDGTVTGEKLMSLKKRMKGVDTAILDRKNTCLEMLSTGCLEDLVDSGYASPVKSDNGQSIEKDSNQSFDTMQKVLEIVSEENILLRSQLTCTLNKLEEILVLSRNINNEVGILDEKFTKMGTLNSEMASFQEKLDQERELLLAVQADRDLMRDKLKTLEELIKEEEEFLGDSKSEPEFYDSGCSLSAGVDEFEFTTSM